MKEKLLSNLRQIWMFFRVQRPQSVRMEKAQMFEDNMEGARDRYVIIIGSGELRGSCWLPGKAIQYIA